MPRPVRRQAREDVEAEIAFHLDARTDELVAAGVPEEEARRRAEREFGDPRLAGDRLEGAARRRERRSRLGAGIAELLGDLRYGLRGLMRNPGFAVVAILTLGLAIATSTAVFSVVNAVLLRPLPYPAADELALVWAGRAAQDRGRPDYLTAEAWRTRSRTFADMAFLDPVTATLPDPEGAERVSVARISPNFFSLLGIEPLAGRDLTVEDADTRRRVALLDYEFWQRRYGGEDVVGRTLPIDGRLSTIVGILPRSFDLPGLNGDLYEPYSLFPDWEATENEGRWYVLGRLRTGASVHDARDEMASISRALDATRPVVERDRGVAVVPLERYVVGDTPRTALWMLTGAALLVLLIAAVNVISLSLARGLGRTREFGVRAALGASRARLVRQLLTEGLALGLVAGACGTLLALAGTRLLRRLGPADLPRLGEAALDPSVLVWTLGLSVVAGLLIGTAPAATMGRREIASLERSARRGGRSSVGVRAMRRGLVVAELAVAIILLAGAGLLIRSWTALSTVDPGFQPDRILSLNLSTSAYPGDASRRAFYEAVLDRLEALPGIEDAGLIGDFLTDGVAERTLTPEGAGSGVRTTVRADEISDDLFATVGARVVAGRPFDPSDDEGTAPVAIVNEALASRLFPGTDAVGRRFKNGPADADAPWVRIVGVVADMRRQGLEVEAGPQLFVPLAQGPSASATLLVRTAAEDPLDLLPEVRATVHAVDGRVPVYLASSLEDGLGADLAPRRFQTSVLILFAAVALTLAAIGVYGLIQYTVSARRREFAIRQAVGAGARDILSLVFREGLRLCAMGLLLGLIGAIGIARVAARLLYGVSPADLPTLLGVAGLTVVVAWTATWVPARRASRVQPVEMLRRE